MEKIYNGLEKIFPGKNKVDFLYNSFLKTIDSFLKLGKAAPDHLTKKANSHNELTDGKLENWNNMLSQVENNSIALKAMMEAPSTSYEEINQKLNFYRSLPRWLEEIPCQWSSYYTKILETVHELGEIRYKIIESHAAKDKVQDET